MMQTFLFPILKLFIEISTKPLKLRYDMKIRCEVLPKMILGSAHIKSWKKGQLLGLSRLCRPLVATFWKYRFSSEEKCRLCWMAAWIRALPKTVLTPVLPCADRQDVSRATQKLSGYTTDEAQTKVLEAFTHCWNTLKCVDVIKCTLCVNILSFASSWTAGFHGEKLEPINQTITDVVFCLHLSPQQKQSWTVS